MTRSTQASLGRVFRIEGPQTIADVERQLAEIQKELPTQLLLPSKPKKWWFGGEAALIQILITWGRRNRDATLVTHIQDGADPTEPILGLVRRSFGFVAAWMAQAITDLKGVRQLKGVANRLSETEIDRMWLGGRAVTLGQPSLWGEEDGGEWEAPGVSGVGDRVFLACVDHHPKWRVPQCYFPTGELRYRDDFVALATSMAERASRTRGGTPITPEVRKPLGSILHELFKNTHEWARTDEDGVPLLRSVRGLLAQGHTWGEAEIAEAVVGSPALASYLKNPDFQTTEGRARFLEFSVFDSGIGLAARWLSSGRQRVAAEPTLEDEHRACLECFQRWKTSSGAAHKGLGLHEVMQTLSGLRGFFRVRTGRLSLYRDFVDRPYEGTEAASATTLTDWSDRTGGLTPLSSVEGVLYTMLIPIRNGRT